MHVLNRFWIRTSDKRQASWRNLGGRKPLGGRLFHASGLEVFLRMTATVAYRNRTIRTASVKGSKRIS